MKIKTSELTGAALDWAANFAVGPDEDFKGNFARYVTNITCFGVSPSTDWKEGGPIIEREGIELLCNLTATEASRFKDAHADWQAFYRHQRATEQRSFGTTPLTAAMRCFVASKLGEEVDVPEELL